MMSPRRAAQLAWSLCALCVSLLAFGVLFLFLNGASLAGTGTWGSARMTVILPVLILTFAFVGALIASRLPGNPVGWICLAAGSFLTLATVADVGGEFARASGPALAPFGEYLGWLENWIWAPGIVLLGTFLPLLFPNGRLLSSRWRPVAWLAAVYIVLLCLPEMFTPGPLSEAPEVENPLGLEGAVGLLRALEVFVFGLPAVFALSALSVVLRFRRSVGVERQQMKWFASAGVLFAAVWPFSLSFSSNAVEDLQTVTFVGFPVAVGVAVLRYRLYDIDLIINRALVYLSLTAMLVGLYVGSVVALQYVLRTFTGQESQLAVVASTLAIAALFNPLRRRLQRFVDRRFYRSTYDARTTLESFTTRLRDETQLDALSGDLEGVVTRAMQPEHVTLWLRPAAGTPGRGGVPPV